MAGRSNVLFVVLDTVRKGRLTPYGYDRDTTPELAAFAEGAAVFEEAVAPAPWTLPVHASMFTGLYPSGHGADQENPYLEGATTLAATLSAAGYDTACYSSNAWITPYTHLTDGFDEQDNFFQVMPGDLLSGPLARAWRTLNDSERLRAVADKLVSLGNTAHEVLAGGGGSDSKTPAAVDSAMEFVDGTDDWFVFLNLMDAHLPYYPPEEYRRAFAPGADPDAVCQNSKEYNAGARDIDEAEWAAIRNLYDAEIAHMDDQLGRLFGWLEARGEWEDTTVVVCADHGELHGEHDLYGHEFALYDPLVNVPLLVKHPDLGTGRREDQVELLDLYHTVLDAAGAGEAAAAGAGPGDGGAVPLDPGRSLLSPSYRAFDGAGGSSGGNSVGDSEADTGDDTGDVGGNNPGHDDPSHDGPGHNDAGHDDPGRYGDGEYAFVEYSRPVIELKQLEEKAAAAGVDLDEDSRFYARMRAARRADAKYVRADRIPDEAYRLDEDPGERENLAGGDDGRVAATEAALAAFEAAAGGAWTTAAEGGGSDAAVEGMDEEAQERLRDLGYLE